MDIPTERTKRMWKLFWKKKIVIRHTQEFWCIFGDVVMRQQLDDINFERNRRLMQAKAINK